MRERFPRHNDSNLPTRASGTTRVHPESASQTTSSWLWIVLHKAGRLRRRRSSKSSCRRNAHGIQVLIMRQLIATNSGGHSAIPVAARRTSQRTKSPKRMTTGTNRTTRSSKMLLKPSTSSSEVMKSSIPGGNRNCSSEKSCPSSRRYQPLRWSEVPFSFSRDDKWTSFLEPGKFPMVLDLVVAEVKLTRVLIDGGSGLNLIFASTLRKMGLDLTDMLVPSKSPFYGIVPCNAAHPLGTMVLPVTFSTRENYRTNFIKFEVANFESSYHAILGRPALAKFMVVPHYIYLLLKMPG
jgi:hypothetical protein